MAEVGEVVKRDAVHSGALDEVVGVVPAAGFAERLQPLDSSKETYSVAGTPLAKFLFDRLHAGGCSQIVVVTRPAKQDVVALAAECGARVVLASPPTLAASIATGLEGLPDDAIVLLGFPDSIWLPVDGFAPLVAEVRAGAAAALGLFRVDEPWRSDVVAVDERGVVSGIQIKPRRPKTDWIWGCLAGRAGALRDVGACEEASEHLLRLGASERVVARRLSDVYLDVGTRDALAIAERWLRRHDPVA